MKRFFEIYSRKRKTKILAKMQKSAKRVLRFSLLICLFSVAFIKLGAVISTKWDGFAQLLLFLFLFLLLRVVVLVVVFVRFSKLQALLHGERAEEVDEADGEER